MKWDPVSQWPGRMPIKAERDRRHDDDRRQERLKLRDDQQINQHQRRREGETHIPKRFIGNVPLAVPLHGEPLFRPGLRHTVVPTDTLPAACTVPFFSRYPSRHRRGSRPFVGASAAADIRDNVDDRLLIFMIDRLFTDGLFNTDEFGAAPYDPRSFARRFLRDVPGRFAR